MREGRGQIVEGPAIYFVVGRQQGNFKPSHIWPDFCFRKLTLMLWGGAVERWHWDHSKGWTREINLNSLAGVLASDNGGLFNRVVIAERPRSAWIQNTF